MACAFVFCLSLSHYGSQDFHLSQQGQARFSRSTRLAQVTRRFITHFYSPKFWLFSIPFNLSIHSLMLAHMHSPILIKRPPYINSQLLVPLWTADMCVCTTSELADSNSSGCVWIRWISNLFVALTLCLIAVPAVLMIRTANTHKPKEGYTESHTQKNTMTHTEQWLINNFVCSFAKAESMKPHTVKSEWFIEILKRRQAFYCFFEFSWTI